MATHKFEAIRLTDAETIEAFRKIARVIERDDGQVNLVLAERHPGVSHALASVEENPVFQEVLKANTATATHLVLTLPSLNSSITVYRQPKSVEIQVSFPDQSDGVLGARLIREAHINLRGFDSTESIRRLLGDELAEFYARREQALMRLEDLNQRLTDQNEVYRRKLDEEREDFKNKVSEDAVKRTAELEAEYAAEHATLGEREQALAARAADLDDRDSRHVRREIRKDLKRELGARGQHFTLTKATTRKRVLVHVLFGLLLLGSATLAAHGIWSGPLQGAGPQFWFHVLRVALGVTGFAASILFYIRWNDHWSTQHADEEFRLKKMELDIDRASWVVETAMEWKGEKGDEIPEELVERLTRGLFTDRERADRPRHPSEDLASALFDSVKSMRMVIPGLGEAELDRRALRRFRAAAASRSDTE